MGERGGMGDREGDWRKGGGEGSNGRGGFTVTVEDVEGVDDHCDEKGWCMGM